MLIPCTIQIGVDATDPDARDSTVKIIDEVLEIIKTGLSGVRVVEIEDDRAIITGYIEIEKIVYLD